MTPEQIKLEFAHLAIDKAAKDGNQEVFHDEEFEQYDKETEDKDSRLSDIEPLGAESAGAVENEDNVGDWEDVEIDDFEPSGG